MREIRFKFWTPMLNEMSEPTTIQEAMKARPTREHRITLQFTGKWSYDHQEIYEGDIITFTFNSTSGITEHKGVVAFDQCMFLVDEFNDKGEVEETYSLNRVNNVKLIGNVYENPELT